MTRTHYQQIERGWWKKDAPSNPQIKSIDLALRAQ
jgi:hypothetical protein